MTMFSGWKINNSGNNLKTFSNEDETIVLCDNEVKVSISKVDNQPEMIQIKSGGVKFIISHEHKVINIFYK